MLLVFNMRDVKKTIYDVFYGDAEFPDESSVSAYH